MHGGPMIGEFPRRPEPVYIYRDNLGAHSLPYRRDIRDTPRREYSYS